MEIFKDELIAVNEVEIGDGQLNELNELQLAMVGGGVGDVIIV